MARANYHSSNPIPTSILTAINADAGHFPPTIASANASECHGPLAASSCAPPAGDEHAPQGSIIHEQYDSYHAANSSAASDHVLEYVAATAAGISAELAAEYFSAASDGASTGAVDGLAAAESAVDNSVSAAAAVFAAANI